MVSALLLANLYVCDCCKGRREQKRTWGVEMNEAQQTHLKNYSAVDKIDQMLLVWDLTFTGHGGGGVHPPDMQKQLP
jgi:hypothetical protein